MTAAEVEPPLPSLVASCLEFALNAELHFGKKAQQESTRERMLAFWPQLQVTLAANPRP